MTHISLGFSLARESSYNKATFNSIEEKEEYVAAEFADLKLRDLYKQYSGAMLKTSRLAAAKQLDSARYQFYKAWLKKHDKSRTVTAFPTLPPESA